MKLAVTLGIDHHDRPGPPRCVYRPRRAHGGQRMKDMAAARSPLALLTAVALAVPASAAATGLLRSPDPDVPAWLHVSTADTASCTLQIQVMTATLIVVCGAAAVTMVALRRLRKAGAHLAVLAYGLATAVFVEPIVTLGARNAYPPLSAPGSLDPVPLSTDFNFRTYLPDLLAAITTPALWAAAATVPLGLTAAAAVSLNHRRRRASATAVF